MLDVIIKNGEVIDGTGKERYFADVGILGDKIKEIGSLKKVKAKKIIDAKNKLVCPGFVDILNHSDSYFKIFTNPTLDSMALQGVTTIIGGNCGSSLAPLVSNFTLSKLKKGMGLKQNVIFTPSKGDVLMKSVRRWTDVAGINIGWLTLSEFFETLENRGLSLNFGTLIGHSSVRRNLVGEKISDLTENELNFFKEIIKDSIKQGALGMSCGLSYSHENFVETSELMELASVVAENDGVMVFHLRNESERFSESVREVLEIARRSGARVEISHFKILGKENWERLDEVLAEIEEANEQGVEVNFDLYPYDASWTVFYTYLPNWLCMGGREKFLERLSDEKNHSRIISDLKNIKNKIKDLIIAYCPFNRGFVGKTFNEIAVRQGNSLEETVINVLLGARGHLICFDKSISLDNINKEIKNNLSMISSDGVGFYEDDSRLGQLVHPRCFGAFSRFLSNYIKKDKILSWEKAIQKITSMPALKYGLDGRGFLQKGLKADVVVFDQDKISDRATFENPYQYSRGIDYVLVNGKFVVEGGKHTGELAGEVIRK